MKKYILIFITVFLMAQDLRVRSQNFIYDSKKMVSIFSGDVNATRGQDNILADKMYVYFNEQKKPVKFEALQNVKVFLGLDKNSTYKGKCNKLTYLIKSGDIILKGNAFIKRIETNESISGDLIKINRYTKDKKVSGNKKPVNIIIKVD